ncbi:MAG: peptidoglycan bridge formation glycyltransferase FemA/FemB family protein [Anaerolineae bacterium]|nr:peptidoglycan bridge formation glycyltransferase FemA/FemB family protein [Anaerolineae bacterium]
MAFEILRDVTAADWNRILSVLPGAHILQTWEWAEVKEIYGWRKIPLVWRKPGKEVGATAMVLLRALPRLKLNILYVPRGPVLNWEDRELREEVLFDLVQLAIRERAIFIKVDGEIITGYGEPGLPESRKNVVGGQIVDWLRLHGWQKSDEQIQFANTIWVNLKESEEEILARMKQKTRYNIRLAQKKGVKVRLGNLEDLITLYKMYAETSVRDGFVIRSWDYYRNVWEKFYRAGMMDALIAEVDEKPVAGLILFYFAGRAWYLYGMSTQAHREKMPNYLLQWEAMKHARAKGCSIYDLWGAPTDFCAEDVLWNVYRFKDGFSGEVICTAGAWDYPVHRRMYMLYMKILPKILGVMRLRGKSRTQREAAL